MDMIKTAGIAILVAVVLLSGFVASRVCRDKVKMTEAFIALITRLRSLIEFDRGELAELYPMCDGSGIELLEKHGFLTNASELGWQTALERLSDVAFIESEVHTVLTEFGDMLGKTLTDEQLRNCDRTLARLNEISATNRPELARRQKLCRTLSLSAALTVVLLLI